MASTGSLASSLWVYGMLLCSQQRCTDLARGTCRGAWGSHVFPDMAGVRETCSSTLGAQAQAQQVQPSPGQVSTR